MCHYKRKQTKKTKKTKEQQQKQKTESAVNSCSGRRCKISGINFESHQRGSSV